MNRTVHENNNNLIIAEAYYDYMLKKNFDAMENFLHPDVHLISPLAEITGKDAVVKAAKNLSSILANIQIRAKFSSDKHVMLAYDFIFSNAIGKLRAAVLMDFENQLISKIELFYDSEPFQEKNSIPFSN